MVRLKVRNGAFVVITAILMVSMFAVMAVAVDFSRMGSLRNELQTSADAAALGGGMQIQPGKNGALAYDSALSYATRNKAMQGTVTLDSVIFGHWDDVAATFTPFVSYVGADAIQTVVSRQSTGLTMTGLLGVAAPRIKARATAWAEAPLSNYGCIKPWAIPYPLLMSRINAHNGVTNTAANLVRPFTAADLDTLMAMTPAERQFALHLGNGQLDTSQISGNYQAVKLGKYWDAATRTYVTPQPVNGAQAYRDNVSGATCYGVNIGDSLQTNQGLAGAQNTVDPFLVQGTPPMGVCTIIRGYGTDNTPQSDPRYGDCVDANGNVGVSNISLFYACTSGCNGASTVATMMMASFKIDKVYPQRQQGNPSTYDMAEITGTFQALSASGGRVGPSGTSSVLTKIILVR